MSIKKTTFAAVALFLIFTTFLFTPAFAKEKKNKDKPYKTEESLVIPKDTDEFFFDPVKASKPIKSKASKPKKPKTAKITKITYNKKSGIKLTFLQTKCNYYKVYKYSDKTKEFKYIGSTKRLHYYDRAVAPGKRYTYKVRCTNVKIGISVNGKYSKTESIRIKK